MFALTFLVFQVVYSYEVFKEVTLPDFDEVFDAEGKPDVAKDYELKRLLRKPRRAGGKCNDTEVLMIENKGNVLSEADFYDFETEKQKDSKEWLFQYLKNVDTAPSTRNPFFVAKNYMRDSNLFHSPSSLVNINGDFTKEERELPLATPYARSSWEPNFLRNFMEHE